MQRLAWFISRAYHKRAIQLHDAKKYKDAYSAANSALQFLQIHDETFRKNKRTYPFLGAFKSNRA